MTITPVDFSAFGTQRSDISKIAGDDYLRIQQQQMANAIRKEEEEHELETKQIEATDDVKIAPDSHSGANWQKPEDKEKKEIIEETEEEDTSIEYVSYNDPDVGKALDWKG